MRQPAAFAGNVQAALQALDVEGDVADVVQWIKGAAAFNNYKDYDYDGRTELSEEDETLNWIGVKQQFFASVIEAKNGFTKSQGHQDIIEKGNILKKFQYSGQVQLSGGELHQDFSWYFLPLDLDLLKSYDKNFDEIFPFGWAFS